MIKTEYIILHDEKFKRTYSDANFMIQKKGTNEIYNEAVDVLQATFEYVETDKYTYEYIQKMLDNKEITQEEANKLLL